MLTVTSIDNPRQTCTKHYDIWFFVPLSEESFRPNQSLLDKEFYDRGWKSIDEARRLTTDPATLEALSEFENLFNKG